MQDPVCGMTVEPHQAAGTDVYNGTTYAFCSRHCLHAFELSPHAYLDQRQLIAPEAKAAGLQAHH